MWAEAHHNIPHRQRETDRKLRLFSFDINNAWILCMLNRKLSCFISRLPPGLFTELKKVRWEDKSKKKKKVENLTILMIYHETSHLSAESRINLIQMSSNVLGLESSFKAPMLTWQCRLPPPEGRDIVLGTIWMENDKRRSKEHIRH